MARKKPNPPPTPAAVPPPAPKRLSLWDRVGTVPPPVRGPKPAPTPPQNTPATPKTGETTPPTPGTPLRAANAAETASKPAPSKPKPARVAPVGPKPAESALGGALRKALAPKADMPTPPHLIVIARAGTGKTTSKVEGLKYIRGEKVSIKPSPQQLAIWNQMILSKDADTIAFVAFNVTIATELKSRVPQGVDAMTMNAMGNRSVTKAFGRQEPTNFADRNRLAEILGQDSRDLQRQRPGLVSAVEDLVALCKQNLVEESGTIEMDMALHALADHYAVEIEDSDRVEVFQLVPEVIEMSKDPRGEITFTDQVWLPVALNLPIFRYDLLLVDEAQDLNRCQQALAKRAGRRLILVGDDKQAIYGFAGASEKSMKEMETELGEQGPGCVVLPLTVTRRCGKAIVREAQRLVPDFEAHESNPEGEVLTARYQLEPGEQGKTYHELVQDGDMVLCRVNAPLVSQCFKFIGMGRNAFIRGRDIVKGLVATVKKMKAKTVPELCGRLTDWAAMESAKEQAKRNPSDTRLIAIADRLTCLLNFTKEAATVEDVLKKIDNTFFDLVCPKCGKKFDAKVQTCYECKCPLVKPKGIQHSSIHKAKGLEAENVFFLRPKGGECPHPMAKTKWQQEQEKNLEYVAITRAIRRLYHVR